MSEAIISPLGALSSERGPSKPTLPTVVPLTSPSLPDGWRFEHGIADISGPSEERVKVHGEHLGTIVSRNVWLEDGSEYVAHFAHPAHQTIDIVNAKTTAYMTRHDTGMNRHHQHRDMQWNFPSLLISREIEWKDPLSQARTAYNQLLVTKELIVEDGTVDPVNIEESGISKGAMDAFMKKALTSAMPELGLNLFYFNTVGPCYPKHISFNRKYLAMPIREPLSLGYHYAHLPGALLRRYPGTVDLNKRAIVANYFSLTNGDAGTAVDSIPTSSHETNGYVLVYDDDTMSMGRVWEEKFSGHSGVHVELSREPFRKIFNGHLRVLSLKDLEGFGDRQRRLGSELRGTNNVNDVDFEFVNEEPS